MNDLLQTPIEFLKGVGPQRAQLLRAELGIATFGDLLYHFPFRYVDRSSYQLIKDVHLTDGFMQLKGTIIGVQESGIGKNKRLTARFQDESGVIELLWFQGFKWILPSLKPGVLLQVFGKPKQYGKGWNIPHPEITEWSKVDENTGWQPVYSSTEKLTSGGLHSRGIHKLINALLAQLGSHSLPDAIPVKLREELRLPEFARAIVSIHNPNDIPLAQLARTRFKLEELLHLQIELLLRKTITMQRTPGNVLTEVGEVFHNFYENHMPFPLTNAQKRVLKEIRKDMGSGIQMNRLLQGDVGSGKTVVALLTMLMGIGNGFQGAIMAPTEILANQHFIGIQELLANTDVKVALLTGSTKKAARRVLHEGLLNGEIHILVGTHALLEDIVQFNNLGIVVIDEQHRFGVAQRARMWKKNTVPPHVLIMTATPIPRTLAMTFYGDLDVSVIDELPPGRKPITTQHKYDKDRLVVFGFMRSEIAKGRQIYVVYPLIQESEKLDYANLMDGFESITRSFPLPEYKVSIVHGQMKPEDKDYEMRRFVQGDTQIMVATTVIEVGVNVPNASVMIIESAERFGLSQLHQLRGRVGRGAEQSFCILMSGDKLSRDSKKRISTMVRTNDGFEISEVDLELRGPGDLMGTQQSGDLDLRIADLAKDGPLVALARDKAREILQLDPRLERSEHYLLKKEALRRLKDKPNWAEIS
ncbi:MAG: ATP-dependent DNA helicase RecG [Candidatus Fluviicola riflensis]|nr:MAG: ATP-dependent DNA helicase RecG [Candidatus Fluviicola riflensis]OGS78835.1 MAG: ATP-dependent DNA helicase RecG [Candidatus Fluviicola riflensis]OGS85857.1 MAG: ATP-dependent DNA helicase RecG [Fluviicola sp. RIFCSPHIGHO2_12_FULL_43_24]OGS86266.1 MAG: ATP-dependent DNA helicase RecG [Fluviicola sp. RIFCSPHIGHO2_01_FULL_43_53]